MLNSLFKLLKFVALALIFTLALCLLYLSVSSVSLLRFLPSTDPSITVDKYELTFAALTLDFAWGFRIHASDSSLRSTAQAPLAHFGEVAITLSTPALLKGELLPETIVVDSFSIDSELSESGLSIAGFTFDASSPTAEPSIDLIRSLDSIHESHLLKTPYFSALRSFHLKHATINFQDQVRGEKYSASQIQLKLDRGLLGKFSASLDAILEHNSQSLPFSLSLNHRAGDEEAELKFEAALNNLKLLEPYLPESLASAIDAPSKISVSTAIGARNMLHDLKYRLALKTGSFKYPALYPEPVHFVALDAHGEYNSQGNNKLLLKAATLTDSSGLKIKASGNFGPFGNDDPSLNVKVSLSDTTVDHLAIYLPTPVFPELFSWLDKNLNQASVHNAQFTMRGPLAKLPFNEVSADTALRASFDYRGLEVQFLDTAPPGKNLSGRFTMDRGTILVNSEQGTVGAQAVSEVLVTISKALTPGVPTRLDVKAKAKGLLPEAVKVIAAQSSNKPIPVSITGAHQSSFSLALPISDDFTAADLVYSVESVFSNTKFKSSHSDISANAKTLSVKANNKKLTLSGLTSFDKLDSKLLQLDGALNSNFSLTSHGKNEFLYDLSFDLQNADLKLPLVSWHKLRETKGSFAAKGRWTTLDDRLTIEHASASGPGLELKAAGELVLANLIQSRLKLPSAVLGANNLSIDYERGQLNISGKLFDLSSWNNQSNDSQEESQKLEFPNFDIVLNLDEVKFENKSVYNLQGTLPHRDGRWRDAQLKAFISASKSAYAKLELNTALEYPTLVVESNNAGELFEFLDIRAKLKSGTLKASLVFPAADKISFDDAKGELTLRDLRVLKSPTLYKILSYLSLDKLRGDKKGTLFEKIRIPFSTSAESITIGSAKADGPLLSILLSGTINRASDELDFQGKAIPLGVFSNTIEKIPLVGQRVADAERNLTGVGFLVTGDSDNPKIKLGITRLLDASTWWGTAEPNQPTDSR